MERTVRGSDRHCPLPWARSSTIPATRPIVAIFILCPSTIFILCPSTIFFPFLVHNFIEKKGRPRCRRLVAVSTAPSPVNQPTFNLPSRILREQDPPSRLLWHTPLVLLRQVVDVYISRKFRRNNPYNFAFVRFEFKNHASRAVQNLNGNCIDGSIIYVSEAKYGRGTRDNKIDLLDHKSVKTTEEQGPSTHSKNPSGNYASFKNALLVVHQKVDNGNQNEANPMKKTINEKSMRKVEVVPSTE
ncbi:hypothetical protein PIB30_028161 [Stylosanthes scabra]|uniref:RRM domain-containing protein n=1 Tax=Stylosanthes scabra TaxID=79078 RepID=A0ABU6Y9K2_9FABA|nr:hypothetical protein [Stylosanthes scabra]